MLDEFRRQPIDNSGHAAVPLAITDRMQVRPIPHASLVALYLTTKMRDSTGEREQTQWALTIEQASWLIEHLQNAVDDIEK